MRTRRSNNKTKQTESVEASEVSGQQTNDSEMPIKKRRGRPKAQASTDKSINASFENNDSFELESSQNIDESTETLLTKTTNNIEAQLVTSILDETQNHIHEATEMIKVDYKESISTVEGEINKLFDNGEVDKEKIGKDRFDTTHIDETIPGEELFEPHFDEDEDMPNKDLQQDDQTIVMETNVTQQIKITSIEKIEEAEEILPEEKNSIIHISNLVRPFTLSQLKDEFKHFGTFDDLEDFWIDKIKSHCFIRYHSPDEALQAIENMNGQHWPSSNPKSLKIELTDQKEFEFFKQSTLANGDTSRSSSARHRSETGSLVDETSGEINFKLIPGTNSNLSNADAEGQNVATSAASGMDAHEFHLLKNLEPLLPPGAASGAGAGGAHRRVVIKKDENLPETTKENDTVKQIDEGDRGERRRMQYSATMPALQHLLATNEPPKETEKKDGKRILYVNIPGRGNKEFEISENRETRLVDESNDGGDKKSGQLMDELFKKTVASPGIYWLPLTEEQATEKFDFLEANHVDRLYITERDAERAVHNFYDYSNLPSAKLRPYHNGPPAAYSSYGGGRGGGLGNRGGWRRAPPNNEPPSYYHGPSTGDYGRGVGGDGYRHGDLSPRPLMSLPLFPPDILDEAAALLDGYRSSQKRVLAAVPYDDYYSRRPPVMTRRDELPPPYKRSRYDDYPASGGGAIAPLHPRDLAYREAPPQYALPAPEYRPRGDDYNGRPSRGGGGGMEYPLARTEMPPPPSRPRRDYDRPPPVSQHPQEQRERARRPPPLSSRSDAYRQVSSRDEPPSGPFPPLRFDRGGRNETASASTKAPPASRRRSPPPATKNSSSAYKRSPPPASRRGEAIQPRREKPTAGTTTPRRSRTPQPRRR